MNIYIYIQILITINNKLSIASINKWLFLYYFGNLGKKCAWIVCIWAKKLNQFRKMAYWIEM